MIFIKVSKKGTKGVKNNKGPNQTKNVCFNSSAIRIWPSGKLSETRISTTVHQYEVVQAASVRTTDTSWTLANGPGRPLLFCHMCNAYCSIEGENSLLTSCDLSICWIYKRELNPERAQGLCGALTRGATLAFSIGQSIPSVHKKKYKHVIEHHRF